MGLWAVSTGGGAHVWATRRRTFTRGNLLGRLCGGGDSFLFVEWSRKRKGACGNRHLEVRAMVGRNRRSCGGSSSSGNNDRSLPDGDDYNFENAQSGSYETDWDWRTFRANLVAREQVSSEYSEADVNESTFHEPTAKIGNKWAHPIAMPEKGCVLVATRKLDGVRNYERTVILILSLGSTDPEDGPLGIIINCPLHKKIKQMNPTNDDLATTFSDCSLHFGGPLDASMFLLRCDESLLPRNLEQVVPGICFGAKDSLHEAAGLVKKGVVKPQDFRFFIGYAGWNMDQLMKEIESQYWVVAACSTDLISCMSGDSSHLWEDILQLMGGQFSEMGRKPRQDRF